MNSDKFQVLQKNLETVQVNMAKACERAKRDIGDITLVGVTKAVEIDMAEMLIDAGVSHLGENRLPEGERKIQAIGDRCTWHMIGHLQRNKVKKAMPHYALIHSVDSIRLLEDIEKHCALKGFFQELLLEVNVSGETSKHGLEPGELNGALLAAAGFSHIKVRGLMTMAPLTDDPEETRPVFRGLREMLEERSDFMGRQFNLLSMGMTNDYMVAIEEGATHIRVGTALFNGL